MERKRTEKKIRWKKTGGGSLRLGSGKIIKPNQIFEAYPSQVPEGFRDVVIALDELPEKKKEKLNVTPPNYELKERSKGWFDVIGPTGKVMNENALRRQQGLDLIKSYQ